MTHHTWPPTASSAPTSFLWRQSQGAAAAGQDWGVVTPACLLHGAAAWISHRLPLASITRPSEPYQGFSGCWAGSRQECSSSWASTVTECLSPANVGQEKQMGSSTILPQPLQGLICIVRTVYWQQHCSSLLWAVSAWPETESFTGKKLQQRWSLIFPRCGCWCCWLLDFHVCAWPGFLYQEPTVHSETSERNYQKTQALS